MNTPSAAYMRLLPDVDCNLLLITYQENIKRGAKHWQKNGGCIGDKIHSELLQDVSRAYMRIERYGWADFLAWNSDSYMILRRRVCPDVAKYVLRFLYKKVAV